MKAFLIRLVCYLAIITPFSGILTDSFQNTLLINVIYYSIFYVAGIGLLEPGYWIVVGIIRGLERRRTQPLAAPYASETHHPKPPHSGE